LTGQPPAITTLLAAEIVGSPETWKIHTSFAPPGNVTFLGIVTDVVHFERPGTSGRPPMTRGQANPPSPRPGLRTFVNVG
jgi:hypothetical protein